MTRFILQILHIVFVGLLVAGGIFMIQISVDIDHLFVRYGTVLMGSMSIFVAGMMVAIKVE